MHTWYGTVRQCQMRSVHLRYGFPHSSLFMEGFTSEAKAAVGSLIWEAGGGVAPDLQFDR